MYEENLMAAEKQLEKKVDDQPQQVADSVKLMLDKFMQQQEEERKQREIEMARKIKEDQEREEAIRRKVEADLKAQFDQKFAQLQRDNEAKAEEIERIKQRQTVDLSQKENILNESFNANLREKEEKYAEQLRQSQEDWSKKMQEEMRKLNQDRSEEEKKRMEQSIRLIGSQMQDQSVLEEQRKKLADELQNSTQKSRQEIDQLKSLVEQNNREWEERMQRIEAAKLEAPVLKEDKPLVQFRPDQDSGLILKGFKQPESKQKQAQDINAFLRSRALNTQTRAGIFEDDEEDIPVAREVRQLVHFEDHPVQLAQVFTQAIVEKVEEKKQELQQEELKPKPEVKQPGPKPEVNSVRSVNSVEDDLPKKVVLGLA